MITISNFSFNNPRYKKILRQHEETPSEVLEMVTNILRDVKNRGDTALFEYMLKYDHIDLSSSGARVKDEEFDFARSHIPSEYAAALKEACDNLLKFHRPQLPKPYSVSFQHDVQLERRYATIEKVGICVPSDQAPLSSSLYMNLIPAIVAGTPKISIIAAPKEGRINEYILYIAESLGIKDVYKISGAQGVAALAYGTETIPAVNKIVGPGNIYVQTAKRLLYGIVGIDSIAGPSEVVIISDEHTPPDYIAADLLAQAEHGTGLEAPIAFCLSWKKAEEIKKSLDALIEKNNLNHIPESVFGSFGNIFVVDSIQTAIDATNQMAPEHVELLCEDNDEILQQIKNAGAVFVGNCSPEAVGDYYCGTNHVLPTLGTARFSSGLSVFDFIRGFSIIQYTKEALQEHSSSINALAKPEGMRAHVLSVEVRLKDST